MKLPFHLERLQCFTEGEITLVDITYDNYLAAFGGGEFSFSGRVGVCQNRVYGSVCDVDWDQNDAASMCNSFVTPTSGGMYGEEVDLMLHSQISMLDQSDVFNSNRSM